MPMGNLLSITIFVLVGSLWASSEICKVQDEELFPLQLKQSCLFCGLKLPNADNFDIKREESVKICVQFDVLVFNMYS